MDLESLLNNGCNISVTIALSDLKEWALDLIKQGIEIGRDQKTPESYLTQKEVAEKLNVSENTLWRWKKIGYLSPVKVGNSVYYKLSDIEKLYKKED
ncbi:helix-turn-helix domain-containing protein [Prevotella sp.]|uniref:helix-turn-helix domain-containing protein n=1 Tax=Prevotella sp. TaxID=59823 RepID=UPI0040254CD1